MLRDGSQVPLSALANVTDGHEERRQLALLDGEPVVAFGITRTRGSSELEVGAGVEAAIEKLEAAHPVIFLALGSQHNHRHIAALSNRLQHLKPIEIGHHHIQQN